MPGCCSLLIFCQLTTDASVFWAWQRLVESQPGRWQSCDIEWHSVAFHMALPWIGIGIAFHTERCRAPQSNTLICALPESLSENNNEQEVFFLFVVVVVACRGSVRSNK